MEPADMTDAVSASMRHRTGRSVPEWVDLIRAQGPDPFDQLAVRTWLRDVHGVPQNSQWAIAFAAAEQAGWARPDPSGYADSLYAGPRVALRPLHDAVIALALGLGPDTEAQGRSTYIPVVRRTQFAAVAPGPRGTLRVGLRFRTTVPHDPRLEPAKGFAQATHWIHLPGDSPPSAAGTLEPTLAAAYAQDG